MSEIITAKVLLPDSSIATGEIKMTNTRPGLLVFSGLDVKGLEFEGKDLFEALRALRAFFEQKGCRVLCAGARTDVYPSGMSRDMSAGRKAYVMRLGVPATEIIDIFEEAPSDLVGTVEQQMEYHDKWIRSLKR